MKRRQAKTTGLAKRKARLKRDAQKTARAAVGLTPLGPALTAKDIATNASRLLESGRAYGSALLKEGKKRGKRIVRSAGL